MKSLMLLLPFIAFSLFISSCNSENDLFPVKINIVHDQDKPNSLNNEFNVTTNSYVLVSLLNYQDSVIYTEHINLVKSLPFEFILDPDLPDPGKAHSIQVKVFSIKHNVLFAGDLTTQVPHTLNNNGFIEIDVIGLARCNDSSAGSFCTNRDNISENCSAVDGKTFIGPPTPPPCFGGEGCGYSGSVSFSSDDNMASFHPINSDAIAMLSYSQDDSEIDLYYQENNSNSSDFILINECQEIQHVQSGNVYRDRNFPWDEVIH